MKTKYHEEGHKFYLHTYKYKKFSPKGGTSVINGVSLIVVNKWVCSQFSEPELLPHPFLRLKKENIFTEGLSVPGNGIGGDV